MPRWARWVSVEAARAKLGGVPKTLPAGWTGRADRASGAVTPLALVRILLAQRWRRPPLGRGRPPPLSAPGME